MLYTGLLSHFTLSLFLQLCKPVKTKFKYFFFFYLIIKNAPKCHRSSLKWGSRSRCHGSLRIVCTYICTCSLFVPSEPAQVQPQTHHCHLLLLILSFRFGDQIPTSHHSSNIMVTYPIINFCSCLNPLSSQLLFHKKRSVHSVFKM